MYDQIQNRQRSVANSLQSIFGNEELLAKVIEFFPYPILIYDSGGTSVMVNQAMLKEFHVSSPDMVIGKFNVLKEPFIIKAGIINEVKRAFQGETVVLSDIKVPLEDIAELHNIQDGNIETVYQDITFFPILDTDKSISFIVALLINRRVYRGNEEILRAKEYIESHWQEPLDVNEAAKAAGFSKTHFVRLFKKHTGLTPYDYYINIRTNRIKEKLSDVNLSVTQAFASCGVDYNGHFARVFKERVGLSPSQYRKAVNQK